MTRREREHGGGQENGWSGCRLGRGGKKIREGVVGEEDKAGAGRRRGRERGLLLCQG